MKTVLDLYKSVSRSNSASTNSQPKRLFYCRTMDINLLCTSCKGIPLPWSLFPQNPLFVPFSRFGTQGCAQFGRFGSEHIYRRLSTIREGAAKGCISCIRIIEYVPKDCTNYEEVVVCLFTVGWEAIKYDGFDFGPNFPASVILSSKPCKSFRNAIPF
jgi:hypothetical protein